MLTFREKMLIRQCELEMDIKSVSEAFRHALVLETSTSDEAAAKRDTVLAFDHLLALLHGERTEVRNKLLT